MSDLCKGLLASPTVRQLAPTVKSLQDSVTSSWSSVKEYAKEYTKESFATDVQYGSDSYLYGPGVGGVDAWQRAEQQLEKRALDSEHFAARWAQHSRDAGAQLPELSRRTTSSTDSHTAGASGMGIPCSDVLCCVFLSYFIFCYCFFFHTHFFSDCSCGHLSSAVCYTQRNKQFYCCK